MVLGGTAAPAVVLVFGVVAIILALVQAVLMLFRQAALIVLAGVLPLAAAGSIAPMTRAWVRKVTAWMLALICYKPAAAAVYATAFTMIGSGGTARTALMGFAMLALSVVMLPALMKFFTWTTGSIAGGGGGGQIVSAAMGAVAVGAIGSSVGGGALAAQGQASYLNSRLGPQPPGAGSASPPGGPPAGSGPGGQGGYDPGNGTPPSSGPPPVTPASKRERAVRPPVPLHPARPGPQQPQQARAPAGRHRHGPARRTHRQHPPVQPGQRMAPAQRRNPEVANDARPDTSPHLRQCRVRQPRGWRVRVGIGSEHSHLPRPTSRRARIILTAISPRL